MTHVSPSQIATWRGCKRRWAFSRTRPRTSNRYAAFGTKTHEYREKWLRDGVPPDASTPEGRCAIAGLELLPMPGTCMVEIPIRFELEGVQAGAHVHDHNLGTPIPVRGVSGIVVRHVEVGAWPRRPLTSSTTYCPSAGAPVGVVAAAHTSLDPAGGDEAVATVLDGLRGDLDAFVAVPLAVEGQLLEVGQLGRRVLAMWSRKNGCGKVAP